MSKNNELPEDDCYHIAFQHYDDAYWYVNKTLEEIEEIKKEFKLENHLFLLVKGELIEGEDY